MTVRSKVMLAFLVIGLLGFAYLFRVAGEEIKPGYLAAIEDHLVDTAAVFASLLELEAAATGTLETNAIAALMSRAQRRQLKAEIYDYEKTAVDLRVYVTDPEGLLLYDSRAPFEVGEDFSGWRDIARTLKGKYGARSTWEEDEDGNRLNVLYVASPIYREGALAGVVTVGKPTPTAYELYNKLRAEALLALTLVAVLGTITLWFITTWVTRPIARLTGYAQAVRDGRTVQLPELGGGEIRVLGEAFEEMRDSLEGKQYVEQYVQTLTHEIKSPLSAIRGAGELLEEDMPEERRIAFLANIRNEAGRIQRLIDRLLDLSAIENRKGLIDPTDVPLALVVEEAINGLRGLAESAGVHIVLIDADESHAFGERFLLRTAISNLLHNAIDFSPRGGKISVTVNRGIVTVTDEGPGIPEYAMDRIFERFYSLRRPESGKKSSGLGLSIVARIAQLHHGDITVESQHGSGTRAELNLQTT